MLRLLLWTWTQGPEAPEIEAEPQRGKYAREHAMALADIEAARGFQAEHASALADIGEAGV